VTETSLINYKIGDDNKKRVKIMQVRVVIMLQYISSEISKRTDGRKLFIFSKYTFNSYFGGNERRLLEFDSAKTGIYIVSQGGQPYFLKSRPAKYISR